jgi:LysM repeat protein
METEPPYNSFHLTRDSCYDPRAGAPMRLTPYVFIGWLLLALSTLALVACGGSNDDDASSAAEFVTATLPDPLPTAYIIGDVTPVPQNGGGGPTTHTVAPGDTPSSIAAQYNVTVEALMAANGISDPSTLAIGQELTIPMSGALGSTATPASAEATAPTPNASGQCTYTVASGDVADSIAAGGGTTVEELATLNNTTVDDLRSLNVGDVLVVPCETQ